MYRKVGVFPERDTPTSTMSASRKLTGRDPVVVAERVVHRVDAMVVIYRSLTLWLRPIA